MRSKKLFLRFLQIMIKLVMSNWQHLDSISGDVEGLLSLYEASHLIAIQNVLEEAKNFTIKKLRYSSTGKIKSFLAKQVEQSVEVVPLYWRMSRFEAWKFVDLYHMDDRKNPTLLELAQLDYNLVQLCIWKNLRSWQGNIALTFCLCLEKLRLTLTCIFKLLQTAVVGETWVFKKL